MHIRNVIKALPFSVVAARTARKQYHRCLEMQWRLRLAGNSKKVFLPDTNSKLIVSLTSFPARLPNAWIPIECMFMQTVKPKKIVLVLSDSEIPNRSLPDTIRCQADRGLEILWVTENTRSYKKLLPVIEAYPNNEILTIDDDLYYPPDFIESFLNASQEHPGHAIGGIAREIRVLNGQVLPYASWQYASKLTKQNLLFLTGAGGILYPISELLRKYLTDTETAFVCCPKNDDIWFWAACLRSGIRLQSLNMAQPLIISAQLNTPQLMTVNVNEGENDIQLRRIFERFPELAKKFVTDAERSS